MVSSIGGSNAGYQANITPPGTGGNGSSLVTEDAGSNQAMSSGAQSTGDQISQTKKGNSSQAV